MATLLDAQKAPNSAKIEEFVNRQIQAARRRVRLLDFFSAGLVVVITSLLFLLLVQFIDRAYETPPKLGWLVWGLWGALAGGYLYWSVFRPARRQINPYYAARELELSVESAKNSLVNWIDLEDDEKIPPSVRTALGQKAARDLKGLNLNEAIENKSLMWIGIVAAVLAIGNVVVAFLPPTRTSILLDEPANGNVTVFNNQDVRFQVRIRGRIPQPNTNESVRLRLWYNPEDPDTFEERPLNVAEADKRQFELTIPPRQVRMGFQYKIMAGNAETATHTVTCKIIPEFTGFDVSYEYPAYLRRPAEQTNDPNLIAPYGTLATLIAHTNRDVRSGYLEIDGQARSVEGQVVEGQPDSIKFIVPFEKESRYRVWFTTTEGDKNSDPKRFRLAVTDPKPLFRGFDVAYDYPAYLRWKPAAASDVRDPEIEAIRGSVVTLTAKTNRWVRNAQLVIEGLPPIVGVSVPDQPTWVRFKMPAIEKDTTAKVSFTTDTPENSAEPKTIPIRAMADQAPTVRLELPKEDELTLPANGTLDLKGFATDDHGIDGMTLRMKLLGAADVDLEGKPYRNGLSFLRKEDDTWPTRVDYKDFIKLADIRVPKNPNFRLSPGNTVEFWVEAKDNATAPYGPNIGRSNTKRFKVTAPVQAPADKTKIDNRNNELNREQKKHEQAQDEKLRQEKRPQEQPPVKGQNPPEPKDAGGNEQGNPMPMPGENPVKPMPMPGAPGDNQPGAPKPMPGDQKQGDPMSGAEKPDPMQEQRNQEVENAAKRAEAAKREGTEKPDIRPEPGSKAEPGEQRPMPKNDPNAQGPNEQRPMPKNDPNQANGEQSPAGEKRDGNIDKTKEEKGEAKPGGDKPTDLTDEPNAQDRPPYGVNDSKDKPESKQPSKQKDPTQEKGDARPEQSPAQKEKNPERKPQSGSAKPEKDVTPGEEKQPAPEDGNQGPGDQPQPDDVAGKDKPKDRPEPGQGRPQPKNSDPMDTAGEKRGGPKTGDPDAGEGRADQKQGKPDQTAKSEGKPQGGPGQPNNQEPGELDRENGGGELDREVNSPNPELSDKGKSDVERLMRNPKTRDKAREDLDKLEKNAKDQLSRKKAQDLKKAGEEAAKNYDQERPNEDNVDQLAKKLNSKDKKEREEAEQRIKDWQKDQQTKKELENQTDQLKKKKPDEGKKVEQAMNKPAGGKEGDPGESAGTPKPNEENLNEIAKDLQGGDPMRQQAAKDKLEKMMKDPKTREQAKDKLDQMAKDAKSPEEKKNLENAAQKADELAKNATPKPDEQNLNEIARDLQGGDPMKQQAAKDKLEKMMKDPKTREQAKDKLDQMAKDAKSPEEKKNLENAAQKADELAKAGGDKPEPKTDPKDLKEMADKLAGKDEAARQEAKDQLKEMMKDPAKAEAAKKAMEEMAKNASKEDEKKALEEMLKQANEMAKNPPKTDPKELKELAEKMKNADPKQREEAKEKLKEAMKDPKAREQMEKLREQMAKNMEDPARKKEFEDMMRELGGGNPEDYGKPDPADPKNRLKAAELMLEKFKKNVSDDDFNKTLKWTEQQKADWLKQQEATIASLRKQAEKGDWNGNRNVRPSNDKGPTSVKLDPKNGVDPLRGGRYAPPAGYADSYKRFTEDIAGVKPSAPAPK